MYDSLDDVHKFKSRKLIDTSLKLIGIGTRKEQTAATINDAINDINMPTALFALQKILNSSPRP
eukprot:scaffold5803_cov156-Skeletonema_menzelii.AAC.7